MRHLLQRFSWLGLVALSLPARGDISPTAFVGSGIVPVENSSVRMARAVVNIDWGTPCRLTAVFTMENETAAPVAVRLGFPITGEFTGHETDAQLGFSIRFNGAVLDRNQIERSSTGRWEERIWFHCDFEFPPGTTLVETTCNLPASLYKSLPHRERIEYCIETGGQWRGPIGYEEVNFNFPSPPHRDQILRASPAGHETTERGLRWVFRDLEPRGAESDIHVSYWRPGIREKLDELRQACREAPDDAPQALRLARHLFALGPNRGYLHYPPSFLPAEVYSTLLDRIAAPADRALVESRYRLNGEGKYEEISSAWTDSRNEMIRILNECDFHPPERRTPEVLEARDLVETLLARNPHDAAAWNLYLANYHRFRFAGTSPWGFGPALYPAHQREKIKQAAKLCPTDPAIALWRKLPDASERQTEKLKARLEDILVEAEAFKVEFPRPRHHHY